jgi:hypothetical protein
MVWSIGQKLSHGWILERPLGKGGLSELWTVRRGDAVAVVKIFHRDSQWSSAETEECQLYFQNEARWLAELQYPGLVRGLGTSEGLGQPLRPF